MSAGDPTRTRELQDLETRIEAARRLREETGRDVGQADVIASEGGVTTRDIQRDRQAQAISERTGADIQGGDLQRTNGQFELSEQGQREVFAAQQGVAAEDVIAVEGGFTTTSATREATAEQVSEQTGVSVAPGELVREGTTDAGVPTFGVGEATEREIAAERLGPGVTPEDVIETEQGFTAAETVREATEREFEEQLGIQLTPTQLRQTGETDEGVPEFELSDPAQRQVAAAEFGPEVTGADVISVEGGFTTEARAREATAADISEQTGADIAPEDLDPTIPTGGRLGFELSEEGERAVAAERLGPGVTAEEVIETDAGFTAPEVVRQDTATALSERFGQPIDPDTLERTGTTDAGVPTFGFDAPTGDTAQPDGTLAGVEPVADAGLPAQARSVSVAPGATDLPDVPGAQADTGAVRGGLEDLAAGIETTVVDPAADLAGEAGGFTGEAVGRAAAQTPEPVAREVGEQLFGPAGGATAAAISAQEPDVAAETVSGVTEPFAEGVGRGGVGLANVPQTALDTADLVGFTGEGLTATLQGEGGRIVEGDVFGGDAEFFEGGFAEERVEPAAVATVAAAKADPARFTGQVLGGLAVSGGAIGAARLLGGPRAARAVSTGIQPGEEALIAAGRRVPQVRRAATRIPGTGVREGMFGDVEARTPDADTTTTTGLRDQLTEGVQARTPGVEVVADPEAPLIQVDPELRQAAAQRVREGAQRPFEAAEEFGFRAGQRTSVGLDRIEALEPEDVFGAARRPFEAVGERAVSGVQTGRQRLTAAELQAEEFGFQAGQRTAAGLDRIEALEPEDVFGAARRPFEAAGQRARSGVEAGRQRLTAAELQAEEFGFRAGQRTAAGLDRIEALEPEDVFGVARRPFEQVGERVGSGIQTGRQQLTAAELQAEEFGFQAGQRTAAGLDRIEALEPEDVFGAARRPFEAVGERAVSGVRTGRQQLTAAELQAEEFGFQAGQRTAQAADRLQDAELRDLIPSGPGVRQTARREATALRFGVGERAARTQDLFGDLRDVTIRVGEPEQTTIFDTEIDEPAIRSQIDDPFGLESDPSDPFETRTDIDDDRPADPGEDDPGMGGAGGEQQGGLMFRPGEVRQETEVEVARERGPAARNPFRIEADVFESAEEPFREPFDFAEAGVQPTGTLEPPVGLEPEPTVDESLFQPISPGVGELDPFGTAVDVRQDTPLATRPFVAIEPRSDVRTVPRQEVRTETRVEPRPEVRTELFGREFGREFDLEPEPEDDFSEGLFGAAGATAPVGQTFQNPFQTAGEALELGFAGFLGGTGGGEAADGDGGAVPNPFE